MGRLTNDMARLRQNIDEKRENRVKENAERSEQEIIRATSVNTMIAGFASSHASQAKVDAQAREAFVSENTRSVFDLLDQISKEHQSVAHQSRNERAAFVTDVAKKTADLMAEFDANHKETSEKASKDRVEFISNLGHEVASLLENFNTSRNTQARDAAQERADFFRDLASSISQFLSDTQTHRANDARMSSEERNRFVSSLAEHVANQLESINQARSEMAKTTSEERATFVTNLASNVASLVHDAVSDRIGAHSAFFGGGAATEKKNEISKVATQPARVIAERPAAHESSQVQVEVKIEQTTIQPEATQPIDQPFNTVEPVRDDPESVTLWDSLVVKKGKADHEKSKKKHQGQTEEISDKKPDEG